MWFIYLSIFYKRGHIHGCQMKKIYITGYINILSVLILYIRKRYARVLNFSTNNINLHLKGMFWCLSLPPLDLFHIDIKTKIRQPCFLFMLIKCAEMKQYTKIWVGLKCILGLNWGRIIWHHTWTNKYLSSDWIIFINVLL